VKKAAQDTATPETQEGRIEEIQRKLDRLRGLYESFFLGIERAPPNVARRDLNRLILEMQQEHLARAPMRFRFQSVLSRWVLLTTYWNRTLREIEAGTYRRDVARAQRHMAEKGGSINEQQAIALGIPAVRAKAFVERQQRLTAQKDARAAAGRPPVPAGTAQAEVLPTPPATPHIPGLGDADVENVYKRYLETHQRVKDPRPALTLDSVRDRLRAQVPRILAEKGCGKVRLDVAVEDGKVRLKAWPLQD